MLPFELPIHGKKGVDLAAGPRQQISILHAGPAQSLHRQNDVTGELGDEVVGDILVKQNAHW